MKTKTRPVITHAGDIYDRITERIIQLLEAGVSPWSPAHFVKVGFPKNFSSGNHYQGVNTFLLGMQRYASPWWLTYLQAKDLGGQVKKGEKGSIHRAPNPRKLKIMDVTELSQAFVSEIKITMIAGVIHRWVFWPGKWEPYSPQPGDLLRVWEDPVKEVPKLK